jgi:hypothetical protein
MEMGPGVLGGLDPSEALIVLACSGSKKRGGIPPSGGPGAGWPRDLLAARERVRPLARVDERLVLPAWQRYEGRFYRAQGVRAALEAASREGHVVIISGGYGLVRADECIGDYERKLCMKDWVGADGQPDLLQTLLRTEARDAHAKAVVAFVPGTTTYATVVRGACWSTVGIPAYLVRAPRAGNGALPRLGQAFAAFWDRKHLDDLPVVVETLP